MYLYQIRVNNPKQFLDVGRVGFANIGNTCYMNSVLQSLFHVYPLCEYIIDNKHLDDTKCKKNTNLICEYSRLCKLYWTNNGTINPIQFKNIISTFMSQFRGNGQHDAQEFLVSLLDNLHTSISKEVNIKISGNPKNMKDRMIKASMLSWKRYFKNSYSIITDFFYGEYHTNKTCTGCNRSIDRYEPFCTVDININSADTLEECLKKYLSIEIMNPPDSIPCKKCGNVPTRSKVSFWKLPRLLIICFKRFTNDGRKRNKLISFPMDNLMIGASLDNCTNCYQLYSVINHSGSCGGGHYYSYCRDMKGSWMMFDDHDVNQADDKKIVSPDSYILFYRKKPVGGWSV